MWLLLTAALLGFLYALTLPRTFPPRSPIGETMPPRWRPHPRTVVRMDGEA